MTLDKFTTGESYDRKRLEEEVERNLVKASYWKMCDQTFYWGRWFSFQNHGRVQNVATEPSCCWLGERCCLTLWFLVRLHVVCLVCVYFTWRIKVQSVHLSPPTLPTTALRVIKPPDEEEHREKWTMTLLMRMVLATASIPARQITVMNPRYDKE